MPYDFIIFICDFMNFIGREEFFLRAEGMGDIEYFVLVLQATMADFYKTSWMPWVIGAVDGSLICIKTPHDQEHLYMCHKSFHAINTMAVCHVQLSFTNNCLQGIKSTSNLTNSLWS